MLGKMGIIRFALKSAVMGGCIYYTIYEGFWFSADVTANLYKKMYNNIASRVKDNIPEDVINEMPEMMSTSHVTTLIQSSWNKGISGSIKFLVDLPQLSCQGVNLLLSQIERANTIEKQQRVD